MKKRYGIWMIVAWFALAIGCSKDPAEELTQEETRIYITNRDSSVNFGSYNTFSIVDSVAVIENGRLTSREVTGFDRQLIASVTAALEQRGFVSTERNASPDLGVNLNRVYNTSSGIISYPSYWGFYDSYWDPFYWGYGGYNYFFPYSYGVYNITEGAVSIDLVDLKNAESTNKIQGVWNGLIRGQGIFNNQNVQTQVQALFEQSPYLRAQ